MTPFDSVGGLLGQFSNPEQDRQEALKMSLMALGMGLLGARKGQQWQQAGNAGMNALNVYHGSLANADRRRAHRMEEYKFASELLNRQRANEAAEQDQQALSGIFGNTVDLTRMNQGGPTEANAQATRVSPVDQYRNAAAYYARRGNVEAATKFSTIADKMDEEYSTTPQVVRGPGGKLQLAQFGKRGGTKVADGLTPAEKLHFGSTGGQTNVGFDPYSGEAVSAGMPATMDPAQLDASKRGWASQGLEREKFNYQRSKDALGGGVKPQLVDGQWVYPPDAQNPAGRSIAAGGFVPKAPDHTRRELDNLDAQIGIVTAARDAAGKTPSAFSMRRGAATMAGPVAESVVGRFDSAPEREARSYVYNVVSKVINERAGAAQSVQELARLRSFLPAEMDNAKQVQDKLTAFESYLKDQRKAYAGAASGRPAAQTIDFSSLPK